MSDNSISAETKQRMGKPKQATLMVLFPHGKEPQALRLSYQRGDAGERTLPKTGLPTAGNERTEMSFHGPATGQSALAMCFHQLAPQFISEAAKAAERGREGRR